MLKENPRRWVMFPIQFPAIWEFYKKHEAWRMVCGRIDISSSLGLHHVRECARARARERESNKTDGHPMNLIELFVSISTWADFENSCCFEGNPGS